MAQSQDRARFIEQSLQPHQGRVVTRLRGTFSWARREDVIDALQQAYSQIWAMQRIPPLRRPAAYLFAVAGNVLRMAGRRDAIVQLSLVDDMDKIQSDLAPQVDGPEDAASKAELSRVILEAAQALTSKRRALFVAWYHDGIDLAEFARQRGISVSTADNELYRAVDQVKRHVRARLGYDALKR